MTSLSKILTTLPEVERKRGNRFSEIIESTISRDFKDSTRRFYYDQPVRNYHFEGIGLIGVMRVKRELFCLEEVNQIIENSKHLLQLRENWDDNGAKEIKYETFERFEKLLVELTNLLFEKDLLHLLGMPEISAEPKGSILLVWIKEPFRIILRIPVNSMDKVEFFCENEEKNVVSKGKLDTTERIFRWVDFNK